MDDLKKCLYALCFLVSCNGQENSQLEEPLSSQEPIRGYAEQAILKEEVHYIGQFEYILSNCDGPFSRKLNQHSITKSLQITVNKDRVQFLRPEFIESLNVKVRGSWNIQDRSLSRMRGQFGISPDEDWRNAKGMMILFEDSIEGKISNIQINYYNTETTCDVSLKFAGSAIKNSEDTF